MFGDEILVIKAFARMIDELSGEVIVLRKDLDSRNESVKPWDMSPSYPPMDAAANELAVTFADDYEANLLTTVPGDVVTTHVLAGKEFVSKSDFMELYSVIAPLRGLAPQVITYVAGLILNPNDGQYAFPKREVDKIGEVLDRINEYLNGR